MWFMHNFKVFSLLINTLLLSEDCVFKIWASPTPRSFHSPSERRYTLALLFHVSDAKNREQQVETGIKKDC